MYDDTAIVETFVGETTHTHESAAAYARVMDRLWNDAATGHSARKLIFDAVEALPRPDRSGLNDPTPSPRSAGGRESG